MLDWELGLVLVSVEKLLRKLVELLEDEIVDSLECLLSLRFV